MNKLLLIDGHSVLSRAYYGVPLLNASTGLHTNAVFGFINIVLKCIEEEKAEHIAVAFDLDRRQLKRVAMYPEYKGTRKPMPAELLEQVPLARELVEAMNIPILELLGYEADDLLGTVAKRGQSEGLEVTIVSGDRDLLQLSDEHIKILMPRTLKGRTELTAYYPEDVKAQYKVTPAEFIDLKALMGDSSDNIPGLPGVGEKTATDIIVKYGSIENAHEHTDELKPPRAQKAFAEHYDLAVLSKQLATIDINAPIAFDPANVPDGMGDTSGIYTEAALKKLRELELKSLAARFAKKLEATGNSTANKTDDFETEWEQITLDFDAIGSPAAEGEAADSDKAKKDKSVNPSDTAAWSDDKEVSDTENEHVSIDLSKLKITEDPFIAATVLNDAAGEELIGFALFGDSFMGVERRILGLALSEERYYVIYTGERYTADTLTADLTAMLTKRIENKQLTATIGLKSELKFIDIPENEYIYDLAIAAYLLEPGRSEYGYEDIAAAYLKEAQPGRQELIGKTKVTEAFANVILKDKAVNYVALSAVVPYLAEKTVIEKLSLTEMLGLYTDIELPLVYTLNDMEQEGIAVDKQALANYARELKTQIDALTEDIYELAGEPFNINSPKQLGTILFEKLGISGGKKTKTGYSTAAYVLEKLAGEYEIVRKILRYRTLTKLNSTYATGLTAFISEDDRIHGTFNQTVTATGRISSTDPNLQNIPVRTAEGKEIRKVFVPKQGFVFVDADYSQVELRILAALSQDPVLIGAYENAVDIHTLTASEVFHVAIDKVTPEQRRNAKAVNFGIVYGISAFGLGEDLSISRKEANEYIEQYFKSYPKVKEYLDKQVKDARRSGYVKTLFGRVRPIPELKSSNFMQRSFGERIAMNSPIQGTAADVMKIAMNNTAKALKGMRSRLVLQVHDELLIETAPEELDEVKRIVKSCMEEAVSLPVKLVAEVESGDSWYDCH